MSANQTLDHIPKQISCCHQMPATAFIEVYESILLEDPGTQFTSIYVHHPLVFSSVQAGLRTQKLQVNFSNYMTGGGNSNMFLFSPLLYLGKMDPNFDYSICFKWVGEKPPASDGAIIFLAAQALRCSGRSWGGQSGRAEGPLAGRYMPPTDATKIMENQPSLKLTARTPKMVISNRYLQTSTGLSSGASRQFQGR